MHFSYDWIASYLNEPPSIEEMARLLNETGLETETDGGMLEIEHTVNRPDAMNHFGLAREIAVKLGTQPKVPAVFEGDLPPASDWRITSEDVEGCWRYLLLEVENVRATESPAWLKSRLEAIDQTCHNFLVDLTNFLLWEFGHPSHAFDGEKLTGRMIHVRAGHEDETLVTLDGRTHKVSGHMCITDESGPIALGGIMGGQNSEVDESTTKLALELAVFQPKRVRISGRKLGIESDARHRFERGVDEETMARVIRRFVYLLQQEQPEAVLLSYTDMNHKPFEREEIVLRQSRLNQILGIQLEKDHVTQLLSSMDCEPEVLETGWRVRIPGYKVDVTREIDVIEEVIRFAGLDLLESTLPAMAGSSYEATPYSENCARIQAIMPALGFQETCTYSFLSRALEARFGRGEDPIPLRNPMSENQAVMRRSMIPNMLDCVRRNHNRGNAHVSFFEVGRVFASGREHDHMVGVVSDGSDAEQWWESERSSVFFRAKGALESLAESLGWKSFGLATQDPGALPYEHCLAIQSGGRQVGVLATLNAKEKAFWDFNHEIAIFELDLEFLEDIVSTRTDVAVLPEFPGMKIDMAFVLNRHVQYAEIQRHIRGLNPSDLHDLSLFDVYQGKGIAKGKKSLGMRFRFQNHERTLTSEEVSATMSAVVESVKQTFGAEIRE